MEIIRNFLLTQMYNSSRNLKLIHWNDLGADSVEHFYFIIYSKVLNLNFRGAALFCLARDKKIKLNKIHRYPRVDTILSVHPSFVCHDSEKVWNGHFWPIPNLLRIERLKSNNIKHLFFRISLFYFWMFLKFITSIVSFIWVIDVSNLCPIIPVLSRRQGQSPRA